MEIRPDGGGFSPDFCFLHQSDDRETPTGIDFIAAAAHRRALFPIEGLANMKETWQSRSGSWKSSNAGVLS